MLKNATYKDKFGLLKDWLPLIIESVKKDLKNEHLKQDFLFCKKYLAGKNYAKATTEELVEAYEEALRDSENAEALAEFISNRWLLKHGELYGYFEGKLSEINPDFSAIESIDKSKSEEIVRDAVEQFGAPRTYLFAVINSVVFPDEVYRDLDAEAKEVVKQEKELAREQNAMATHQATQKNFEQQMARLTDKYEKKLSGMQKKYVQDTGALKKQIATLQKKLSDQ